MPAVWMRRGGAEWVGAGDSFCFLGGNMAAAFWPIANYSQFVICLWFICILKAFNGDDDSDSDGDGDDDDGVINFSWLSTFLLAVGKFLPFFWVIFSGIHSIYIYILDLNTICNTYKRHSISTWSPNRGRSHLDFPHGMLSICHRRLWWAQSSARSVSSSLICRPAKCVSALIKFRT